MKTIFALLLGLVACAPAPSATKPVPAAAGDIIVAPPPKCPGPTCAPKDGEMWGKCLADGSCGHPSLSCKSSALGSVCVASCTAGSQCTHKDCGITTCRFDGVCAPSCPCQPGQVCDPSLQNLCLWPK